VEVEGNLRQRGWVPVMQQAGLFLILDVWKQVIQIDVIVIGITKFVVIGITKKFDSSSRRTSSQKFTSYEVPAGSRSRSIMMLTRTHESGSPARPRPGAGTAGTACMLQPENHPSHGPIFQVQFET
jgi:hypothetical protein